MMPPLLTAEAVVYSREVIDPAYVDQPVGWDQRSIGRDLE